MSSGIKIKLKLMLSLAALCTMAAPVMAENGAGTPIKHITPPPPPPSKLLAPIVVTGYSLPAPSFDAASHYGFGFLLQSPGNGLGRLFATASTTPSAVLRNNPDPCNSQGDPILPPTGTKVETYTLFSVPGEMGLKYELYYDTSSGGPTLWKDNLYYFLDTDCEIHPSDHGVCNTTTLYRPDGSTINFVGGPGATSYTEENSAELVTLTRDISTGNYTLHDEDATTQVYSSAGGLLSINRRFN